MTLHTPQAWADLLRRAAAPVLAGTPLDPGVVSNAADARAFIDTFRDSSGNRRRVDRPLLSLLLGVAPGDSPASGEGLALHERLWLSLASKAAATVRLPPGDGPLAPEMREHGIEAWTECELSALHALWSIARILGNGAMFTRARGAADWLMREMQPDNATQRPWGAHVFIAISRDPGDDAGLYARTLIHNAMIPGGAPERLSACILLHAAVELEHHVAPA